MNKQELKQWFLNDCEEMLHFWIEAEKTFSGTNNLERAVAALGSRPSAGWMELEIETKFQIGDNWKTINMVELDLSNYTPQDFDAGTPSTHDPRGKFFRYIYLDGYWRTICAECGHLTLREILELNSGRTYTDEQINPYRFIKHAWRFKNEV